MRYRTVASLLGAAILTIAAPAAVPADVTPARVIVVSSIAQLQSAADQAVAGDRIELVDGTYTTSGSITLRRSGTATAPITVAAQNVGGAEIRGTSGFSFSNADFVVVEGFRFTHSGTITIPGGSEHVRFTRNVVQLSGGTNWVTVTGNDAEVDHNTFQNKSTQGVFLQIAGPGGDDMAQRTWIHHNYFHNHTFDGSNGGESIRLGLSFRQLASAFATVEFNLFDHADGDSEAISVKSSDNVVRFNTLRNTRGSIVLRHGNRNLVEGNLMLGGTAGLRFYDNDHVLINNVIQGGTGQIIAGSGDIADDTTGSTSHARPDRVVVAFNTVVGNRTALLQVGQGTDRLGPNQCTFANNIFVGGGSGGLLDVDEATGTTWQGNIVWAGTGGNAPSSGYRVVNPLLVTDPGGLNRLSSGSPAINAAAGDVPRAGRDFDLQTRSDLKDVGADEFVPGNAPRRPLTTADVGPNAGAEPPQANRFEAESATIFHGVVEANHAGFTGTGFVNSDNEIGSYVEWTVTAAAAGPATLTFRFANGTTANRPMDITVNGALAADELSFPGTGAWTTWQTRSVTASLTAGANTVRATGTTANGGPNLDHLAIG
ncbi:MAG TPA: chondroitinase-B domain-containing protein [Actinophytocola sp.]|uniref:chondroitinase-B domain-containing protein n=1 Tax=Actinophytocola sp. TaxID=1872138 RepID=UPI002DDD80D0|nr:chondroitinase-B domain-containing protein [Actinophytocola sp.]HEV2784348.1 chondroitinase-B domain-containing protein [Actinophytocola sp.]